MFPEFFDLEGLEGKPRKAMQLAYDLAAVNNGGFKAAADKAVLHRSPRMARECIRQALGSAGWPHADAQAIAGAVQFEDWRVNVTSAA